MSRGHGSASCQTSRTVAGSGTVRFQSERLMTDAQVRLGAAPSLRHHRQAAPEWAAAADQRMNVGSGMEAEALALRWIVSRIREMAAKSFRTRAGSFSVYPVAQTPRCPSPKKTVTA